MCKIQSSPSNQRQCRANLKDVGTTLSQLYFIASLLSTLRLKQSDIIGVIIDTLCVQKNRDD